MISQCYTQG